MMASESLRSPVEANSTEKKEEEKKSEGNSLVASSYWGISRQKVTREDGTEWPWNCFMPWETYHSNLSIDLTKHHVPKNFLDKVAYRTVKLIRIPTDAFFKVCSIKSPIVGIIPNKIKKKPVYNLCIKVDI
ncbi:hypothetical protein S83_032897 [Arachis hypogaea]